MQTSDTINSMSEREQSINRVNFTSAEGDSFWVERVSLTDATAEAAQRVVNLVVATYSNQFEVKAGETPTPNRPLSAGAVALKYGTVDAVARQHARMQQRIRDGDSYWFVRLFNSGSTEVPNDNLDGLINNSPSRETWRQKVRLDPPNCYVGDILTRPERQGGGLGTAALYTSLKYDGYDPDKRIALDALSSNPQLDDFYRHRGLLPEPDVHIDPLSFLNGEALPQIRYSGKIGDVIGLLEEQVPMLASAVPE